MKKKLVATATTTQLTFNLYESEQSRQSWVLGTHHQKVNLFNVTMHKNNYLAYPSLLIINFCRFSFPISQNIIHLYIDAYVFSVCIFLRCSLKKGKTRFFSFILSLSLSFLSSFSDFFLPFLIRFFILL